MKRKRARVARKKAASRRALYLLTASLLVLFGTYLAAMQYLEPSVSGRRLTTSQLSALADEGRLSTARFNDEDAIVMGEYTAPGQPENGTDEAEAEDARRGESPAAAEGNSTGDEDARDSEAAAPDGEAPEPEEAESTSPGGISAPRGAGHYWVAYPQSDAMTSIMMTMAAEANADVDVDPQTTKGSVKLVTTFLLPLMILANLFALFITSSRGGGSGIGEVMSFGTIKKKGVRRKRRGAVNVTFDQVAGADEAVAELKEVVDYLQDPERYENVGAQPPKGVLMVGPPGCGKTLIAKAVAGEARVPFFSVAGAEFVESLVGVGAARVRDLFLRVRSVAPAIVFIDELDAAGRKRGSGGSDGGSDEREQTLNQMLVEMDGFEVSAGIVVIGATNRPDILDPALLRPGRFDRHITVDQPDLLGREAILELHARGKQMSLTVDFAYIARRTPGFSGADLANVVNEAALLALREHKPEIETSDIEEAIQRVLHGPKRRGQVLTAEERKRAAYHESGHAIVAAAAGRFNEVHRVSILSRGRSLGKTSYGQQSDALLATRSQLLAQIVIAMGGLASEVMLFGEPSTGAEQDLEQASDLAQDMVGRFGMGSRRRRLLTKEGSSFLGDDLLVGQISARTHQEMEDEVDMLLRDAEEEAARLLAEHRNTLDLLADQVEKEETLEGADLEAILVRVRPEVTFVGGPGEGPVRHDRAIRGPLEEV
ncbi:MAG: ATP-dependent zinc metalloprotease FtsH [Actinomycetota bacterium]